MPRLPARSGSLSGVLLQASRPHRASDPCSACSRRHGPDCCRRGRGGRHVLVRARYAPVRATYQAAVVSFPRIRRVTGPGCGDGSVLSARVHVGVVPTVWSSPASRRPPAAWGLVCLHQEKQNLISTSILRLLQHFVCEPTKSPQNPF